jgi:hypothetical protein
MQPRTVIAGPLAAADADAIFLSDNPTAGALTLDGTLVVDGVAIMDSPRRVLITAVADESPNTFTITGTNWSGAAISETLAGPNATTAQSVLDYKTVTGVSISGNAVGDFEIGTSAVGGSPWVRFDDFAPSNISVQCTVSGTVDYTLETTLDDPNSPFAPVDPLDITWVASSDANVVDATTTQQSNFLFAPTFARILLNSGTGTVTATFLQSSNGPR